MALLFVDGFDHYVTADILDKWTYSNYVTITTSGGRTGGYASVRQLSRGIGAGYDATITYGFAAKMSVSCDLDISFMNGHPYDWAYMQNTVRLTTAGEIVAINGSFTSGGTELGRAVAATFNPNLWNYFEVKILMHQSAGTVTVNLNNKEVLALTSKDTVKGSTTYVSHIAFQCSQNYGWLMDDVYVCDGTGSTCNSFLGDIRVVTLLPQTDAVAAGSNAQFTCSTSTDHGALVDESAPDDDTTYLYSSTVNHVDSWEYPAVGYTGTIKAVVVNLIARKVEAGTRTIAAVTKPASTNRVHATNHYLSTVYQTLQSAYEVNPEDSAAWEVADVDGAEFGIKVTL